MLETLQPLFDLLEKYGLPTLFCIWLMWYMQQRVDRILTLMARLTTIMVVLAKVWDVDVESVLKAAEADAKDDDDDKEEV